MRDETKRGAEALGVGLFVGALELAWLSDRFEAPLGRGGVMVLVGTVFIAGITWTMLALRTLANDGPPGPEVDDGLMCMAAMAWAVVVVPPRAENFLDVPPVDDFTRLYFPLSLVVVFAMLAAQKLWKARTVRGLFQRALATLGATSLATAGLLMTLARGEGSVGLSVRAALVGGLALLLAVVLPRNPLSRGRGSG